MKILGKKLKEQAKYQKLTQNNENEENNQLNNNNIINFNIIMSN